MLRPQLLACDEHATLGALLHGMTGRPMVARSSAKRRGKP
jgi:hypothetical protein